MQDCKGSIAKSSAIVEQAISELLHRKIVPDLLTGSNSKPKNCPMIMSDGLRYDFHQSDVVSLTKCLLIGDVAKAEELVASHLAANCPPSTLIISLLASVARLLGNKWCDDTASFAEVTLGMMELHALLRSLDGVLSKEFSATRRKRSILLSVMPGDTHIFAIAVLQSFFNANGWKVDVILESTEQNINGRLSSVHYDIIGLSVSTLNDINRCKSLLRNLKEKSLNPNVSSMVGGLPFILDTNLRSHVGADYVAKDAFEALAIAASICDKKHSFESSSHYA